MDTQSILTQFTPDVRIARRKGVKVRLQNIVTAKMGPWVTDSGAVQDRKAQAAALNAAAAKIDAQQLADVQAMAATIPDYARLTVKELFTLARSHYGMRVTTKTRKPELVRMLTGLARDGL